MVQRRTEKCRDADTGKTGAPMARCTIWWRIWQALKLEPRNCTYWEHTWGGTTEDASGTKMRPLGPERVGCHSEK